MVTRSLLTPRDIWDLCIGANSESSMTGHVLAVLWSANDHSVLIELRLNDRLIGPVIMAEGGFLRMPLRFDSEPMELRWQLWHRASKWRHAIYLWQHGVVSKLAEECGGVVADPFQPSTGTFVAKPQRAPYSDRSPDHLR